MSEQDVVSGFLLTSTAVEKFLDLTTAPTFPNYTRPTILFLRVTKVLCGDATDKRRLLLRPKLTHARAIPLSVIVARLESPTSVLGILEVLPSLSTVGRLAMRHVASNPRHSGDSGCVVTDMR